MAARAHTGFECGVDDIEVLLHRLLTGLILLVKDMIIGRRGKHPGLLQSHLLHKPEIALVRPDPAGDLGIAEIQRTAGVDRLAIVLCVEEELGLPYDSLRAAETG